MVGLGLTMWNNYINVVRCSKCGRFIGEDALAWVDGTHTKRRTECKKCMRVKNNIYHVMNKEKRSKERADYWTKYYNDNIEEQKAYTKKYQQEHKAQINAYFRMRDAMKKDLTPELTKEEQSDIDTLYRWAQELPGGWHIDHIIPLSRGGLHHPNNLQVIPVRQNMTKNNKLPEKFYGRFYGFLVQGDPNGD